MLLNYTMILQTLLFKNTMFLQGWMSILCGVMWTEFVPFLCIMDFPNIPHRVRHLVRLIAVRGKTCMVRL